MKKTVLTTALLLGVLPGFMTAHQRTYGPALETEDSSSREVRDSGRDVTYRNRLDYRYEFNIGWGGFPVLDATNFSNYNFLSAPEVDFFGPGTISDIYSPYTGPTYSTGVLSAEFNIQFKKWFALGLQANFDGLWATAFSSETGERMGNCGGIVFSFLPYARFTYLNRPVVKLYSAVGLGVGVGYRKYDFSGFDSTIVYPSFQMTPIGIMVGKRLYGLFELGIGTVYFGCRAGIGYRF